MDNVFVRHFCGICGFDYDTNEEAIRCAAACAKKTPQPKYKPRQRVTAFDPIHGGEELAVVVRRVVWFGTEVQYDVDSTTAMILSCAMPESYLKEV